MLEITFTNCNVKTTLPKLGYKIKRDNSFNELLVDLKVEMLLSSLTT
jgi:hypothetical protein